MGGARISAIVYLVSHYFGARSFGTFYGTVSITTGVSAGLGPILANYVYDLNHSYELVIIAALPGYRAGGGAVCFTRGLSRLQRRG